MKREIGSAKKAEIEDCRWQIGFICIKDLERNFRRIHIRVSINGMYAAYTDFILQTEPRAKPQNRNVDSHSVPIESTCGAAEKKIVS